MKLTNLLGVVVLLAAASLSSFGAAIDTAGWGIDAPRGLDKPPVVSLTYKQTNHWPAGPFTNGGQMILTNVIIPVYPDQGIGVYGLFAMQSSGIVSTTNTFSIYGDLSADGGRTWTSARPISQAFTPANSNAPFMAPIYIPYTNAAAAQLFRVTAFSNSVPAGSLNHVKFWPTNITLITRKPAQWGN